MKITTKVLLPFFFVLGFIAKKLKVLIAIDGFKIKFPDVIKYTDLGFSFLGGYEKHERKLVKKYLTQNDKVVELGACIGVVSLTINRILTIKTNQVSVEPNPTLYKYLNFNKEINNAHFIIEQSIVTDLEEVKFHLGDSAFLSSSIYGSGKEVKVKGISLEELEKKYFDFTFLVMDIEGSELHFLRAFDLRKHSIRMIILETHQAPNLLSIEEMNECYELLKLYGFNLIEKIGNVEVWENKLIPNNTQ
jgi:FkbM family methyltransferase